MECKYNIFRICRNEFCPIKGDNMSKTSKINDEYYVNFDDHYLYHNDEKIVELNRKPLQILEYFCSYPFCYKTVTDIIDNCYEGFASESTVRGVIKNLRDTHIILDQYLETGPRGSGYKYTGGKIENNVKIKPISSNNGISTRSMNKLDSVENLASMLWQNRPFYQDDDMIKELYFRIFFGNVVQNDSTINSMIVDLLQKSFSNGRIIPLQKLPQKVTNELIVVKESFLLEDIIYEGKHLDDYKTPFDLLDVNEEKMTMIFSGLNNEIHLSMWLSGSKACMPIRHLIKIIFESDRVFNFQVWGYFDKIKFNYYNIKPLSVVYI